MTAVVVCRFKDTMVNTVGHRTTELALELGMLYSPAEALKIGLVDQLVPEDEVLTTATQIMTKWLAIPGIKNHRFVVSCLECKEAPVKTLFVHLPTSQNTPGRSPSP